MKLLVNCSNLHVGGGVAVATSFLLELSELPIAPNVTAVVSSEVHRNLQSMAFDSRRLAKYTVYDCNGIRALFKRFPADARDFDALFTLFGPLYTYVRKARTVTGFAQPWIAYPTNLAYKQLSKRGRLKSRLANLVRAAAFARSSVLVVETKAVRASLLEQWLFSRKQIEVVPNTVDDVFFWPEQWQNIELPTRRSTISLCCVSRNYPHKNLGILPEIKQKLASSWGLSVDIYVTFNKHEWERTDEVFRSMITNVGELELAQVPSLISQVDGVVFPTLLECFSATPLEASVLKKPVFASNLPSVTETADTRYIRTFNPLDSDDAARVIAEYFLGAEEADGDSERLRSSARVGFTSKERAAAYVRICAEVAGQFDETGNARS